jgi:hypothetical protein
MPVRFPTNPDLDGSGEAARVVRLEFFDVELRVDGIVWLKRNWVAYETTADIHRAYDQFLQSVDDWKLERRIAPGQLGTRSRTNIAWLYDLRHAPTQRNDPEFEAAILARRPHLLARSRFSSSWSRPPRVACRSAASPQPTGHASASPTTSAVRSSASKSRSPQRRPRPPDRSRA